MTDEQLNVNVSFKMTPSAKARLDRAIQKNHMNQAALIRALIMKWVNEFEVEEGLLYQVTKDDSSEGDR